MDFLIYGLALLYIWPGKLLGVRNCLLRVNWTNIPPFLSRIATLRLLDNLWVLVYQRNGIGQLGSWIFFFATPEHLLKFLKMKVVCASMSGPYGVKLK